jgi:hypothetical protein
MPPNGKYLKIKMANVKIARFASRKTKLYSKMHVMPQLLMVKTSSRGDGIHHLPIMAGIGLYAADIKIDWLV